MDDIIQKAVPTPKIHSIAQVLLGIHQANNQDQVGTTLCAVGSGLLAKNTGTE